ncbi:MAG TPA: hypothetical protein VF584_05365 [Longimicrobium sp.]
MSITLEGERIWPGGPNDPARWAVDVRRQGGQWVRAQVVSGNTVATSFIIPAHPLLQSAGTLEARLIVDGTHSNTVGIPIVVERPRLTGVSPATLAIRPSMTDANWKVALTGQYWMYPLHITVNGTHIPRFEENLPAGYAAFPLPPEMRKPGRYTVVVRTAHGVSEARAVEVVAPFTIVSTTPGRVMQAALQDTASNVTVTVAFGGTPPQRIAWKTDRTGSWAATPASYNMRNDVLTIQLPVRALRGAQMIDLQFANAAGETGARIPIDQMPARTRVEVPEIPRTRASDPSRVNRPPVQPPPLRRP